MPKASGVFGLDDVNIALVTVGRLPELPGGPGWERMTLGGTEAPHLWPVWVRCVHLEHDSEFV